MTVEIPIEVVRNSYSKESGEGEAVIQLGDENGNGHEFDVEVSDDGEVVVQFWEDVADGGETDD